MSDPRQSKEIGDIGNAIAVVLIWIQRNWDWTEPVDYMMTSAKLPYRTFRTW